MKQTILRWYNKLKFPQEYNEAFVNLLNAYTGDGWTDVRSYDAQSHTAQENLLAYLYFCEALEKKYKKYGIDEQILLHTLSDIVIWTNVWFSIKQELGLGETEWLKRHLSFRLFRLGRLQFCFGEFEKDYSEMNIKKGDNVIEVHIPNDGKLLYEQCDASFEQAEAFFAYYFPDFYYRFYSCHSWLLDEGVCVFLDENSNICRFGARFQAIDRNMSDEIIRYVFRWDATRKNIDSFNANTKLARALKIAAEKGEIFYEVLGIIRK